MFMEGNEELTRNEADQLKVNLTLDVKGYCLPGKHRKHKVQNK